MKVRDVMTTGVAAVTPDTPLKDVARLLVERRISGVPVVDADGVVLGVVSEGDFLLKEARGGTGHRTFWSRLLGREPHADLELATTAGDLMTSPAITIEASRSLHAAAAVMARRKVNRLPVVEAGRLVGIVTRADVVRAFVRSDAELADAAWQAIHAVDGLRVASVREGVVVLEGTVPNRAIAESAREAVAMIDGVVRVDDEGVAWPEPPPENEEQRWAARQDYRDG